MKAHNIEIRNGCLYKLCTGLNQAVLHETSNSNEIWHKRRVHLHFCALPSKEKMVTRLPKQNKSHEGPCKGHSIRNNTKGTFQNRTSKT